MIHSLEKIWDIVKFWEYWTLVLELVESVFKKENSDKIIPLIETDVDK